MHPKLAEIENLMSKGFDVADITSDNGVIEVLLRKGLTGKRVVIPASDAADILFDRSPRAKRWETVTA
ncbi:MAG: hypothetical protein ACT4PT_10580 [Methanobacteriota archaeon]